MDMRTVNNLILNSAPIHRVADHAPMSIPDLINQPTLVIWSGASDKTIFQDECVNWAFRAIHDAMHIKTGLGFDVASEIELGRIQANQYSGLMADIVYIEISEQAKYFLKTGQFVENDHDFVIACLKNLGYKI